MADGTQVPVRTRLIRALSPLKPVAVSVRAIACAAGPVWWRLFLQYPIDIRVRAQRGYRRCSHMYWVRCCRPLEIGPSSQELTNDRMGWLQGLVACEVAAQRLNLVTQGGDLAQG